ncbi:hypothetical protein V6N12_028073 [Hibiscus sabdariffa]|uniref:Uncharacterized protein n=1 Tax=Hibiscus sabdariffa TaxID=183260 RepID=A0ABR2F4S3_9ROSI
MSLSDSSLANRRDLLKGRKWQVATQEACSQCGTRVDSICVQFQGDCFTLGVVKIVDFDPCVLKGKHCLWSWECLGVQFQIRRYIGGGNGKPVSLMNLQCKILLLLKILHSHLVVLYCADTIRDEKEFEADFSFCSLLLRMVRGNGKDFDGNVPNLEVLMFRQSCVPCCGLKLHIMTSIFWLAFW